jgi:prepilin-type N-terminal cleavage/methylation domain-containing protein
VKYLSLRTSTKIRHTRFQQGFSLVEMLVVIGIVSLLSALAVPAFNSLAASRGVTQGLYDVSTLLEFGRTEAVTRQTYVWVVFQNASVGNLTTQSEIRMAAFASLDGTPTTGTGSSNLVSLTKILHIRNVALNNWSNLKSATKALLPANVSPNPSDVFGNNPGSLALLPGPSTQYTITFTPRGEATQRQTALSTPPLTAYSPYDSWMDVSFRQTHGTQVIPNADDAAVIIDGSTGTLQRIRLQ